MASTPRSRGPESESELQIKEEKNGGRLVGYDNPAGPQVSETSLSPGDDDYTNPDPAPNHTDPPEEQNNKGFQSKMWLVIDDVTSIARETAKARNKQLWLGLYLILLCFWMVILILACFHNIKDATVILVFTCIGLFLFAYSTVQDLYGEEISKALVVPAKVLSDYWKYIKWPLLAIALVGTVVALFFLTKENPSQLISAFGLVIFVAFTYVFSISPRDVKWRPVIWGLVLQFLLGFFILRTHVGFVTFQWIGDVVQSFLAFSDAGAGFVFGDPSFLNHFFAFKVLPVVIYFSACISVLYYLGVMQVVIKKIAWLMQKTMQTSASESLNTAGNIFIGQTEAPLLIRPLLKDMTKSEIHAVMTGGFATVAGSVLGAYISFGISASHLISASVMSAPAALAISKLFYPEMEESATKDVSQIDLPKGEQRNVVEAASHGAITAIPLVLNIAANLIAFLALLAFFNGLLAYIGGLINVPELSFEFICSYVFTPVVFIMGVEAQDCRKIAELIGLKTFLNEFVAYEKLGEFIKADAISIRSEIIATYALCGFANFGSVGIMLGGLTPMAPSRKGDLADVVMRALIAGTVACFMTACIAGILYNPDDHIRELVNATTEATMTTMALNRTV